MARDPNDPLGLNAAADTLEEAGRGFVGSFGWPANKVTDPVFSGITSLLRSRPYAEERQRMADYRAANPSPLDVSLGDPRNAPAGLSVGADMPVGQAAQVTAQNFAGGVETPTSSSKLGGPKRFLRGSEKTANVPTTGAFDNVLAALSEQHGGLDKVPTVLDATGKRVPYALDAIAWDKIPDELLTPQLRAYRDMGPHAPTLQEIADHARWIDQNRLHPTVVESRGRWRDPNEKEAWGREGMPEGGRCTPDIPGCGRYNVGEKWGISGKACLGEDCYAGQIMTGKGGDVTTGLVRIGMPAGKQRNAALDIYRAEGLPTLKDSLPGWEITELAPEFTLKAAEGKKLSRDAKAFYRDTIRSTVEEQGRARDWPAIQSMFPDVTIKPKYNGKPLSIARNAADPLPPNAGARVNADFPPAEGKTVRLGVDNTADATMASPEAMTALAKSNPDMVYGIGAEYHGWKPGQVTPPANYSPEIQDLAGKYVHNTTINGQLPLSENLARLLAAGQRRGAGYNNILRVIFADEAHPWGNWNLSNPYIPGMSGSYDKRSVLNRLYEPAVKNTDFYPMGQGYHNSKFSSGPHEKLPLPTCCAGGNCSKCSVNEGVGRRYAEWSDMLREHPEEKIAPTSRTFWQNTNPDAPPPGTKYKPIEPTPGVKWEDEVPVPYTPPAPPAPTFNEADKAVSMATSRARGAVGANAVVPRVVQEVMPPGTQLLDYGAGKEALHAQALRESGYPVTAHDYWGVEGVHDPKALERQYPGVYASNVLNTQNSVEQLMSTLDELKRVTAPGGTFIGNLPATPRKGAFEGKGTREAADWLGDLLRERFKTVETQGPKATPVYVAKDPLAMLLALLGAGGAATMGPEGAGQ